MTVSTIFGQVGTCFGNTKVGYGIIENLMSECRDMGGAVNGEPLDDERVKCHLDFCKQEASEIFLRDFVLGSKACSVPYWALSCSQVKNGQKVMVSSNNNCNQQNYVHWYT